MTDTFSINIILILALISSLIITYIAIPTIIKVVKQKNLYTVPNERSVHISKTPTLGGFAIFAGTSLSMLIFIDNNQLPELKYIIASALIMFFIGMKDDILVIAPWTKMGGQIVSAMIITILGNIRISDFHGFFGIDELPYPVSIIFSIILIIAIINSVNLIDGIDGLAASLGIVSTLSLGIWFYLAGKLQYSTISVCLIGALIAFLKFNLFSTEKKIFMGDTGSLTVGLLLSILIIEFNEANIKMESSWFVQAAPSVSFGIIIVPFFDMLRVMFIRTFLQKSIFKADKRHIHHRFLELGLKHYQIDILLVSINIGFIIFSFWGSQYFSIRRLLLLLILLAMIVFFIPSYILDKRKEKNKTHT